MEKLYNCSIVCNSVDEKIKVLLVLLVKHKWRNGVKEVIGPEMNTNIFNDNLILTLDDFGDIGQGSLIPYKKQIKALSIINETEEYLNELR